MKSLFGILDGILVRIFFPLFFIILFSANADSPIISEIMSNPVGDWSSIPGDDSNEFIEIYNPGPDSIDLAGWSIDDGDDDDILVAASDGMTTLPSDPDGIYTSTVLSPEGFAIILDPEYTDPANDQPYDWPEGTLILSILSTTDLGGSRLSDDDPIYLIDSSGDTVDSYSASITSVEGKSIERLDIDIASGWAISLASNGCTPGARNSVWPYPHDLRLDSIVLVENPVEMPPVILTAFVGNSGEETFASGVVYLFDSSDESNLLDSSSIPTLEPGEWAEISLSGMVDDGTFDLFVRLGEDDFLGNNTAEVSVLVGSAGWPICITEIMFMPLTGSSEWIELYNISDETVEIFGWEFGDNISTHSLPDFSLEPGGFALLCADSASFLDSVCAGASITEPGSWPALNNDNDAARLFDSNGLLRQIIEYDADALGDCMIKGISAEVTEPGGSELSCCPAGGTPGCENAIRQLSTGENSVDAEPNPFDPADGPTTITVCLPASGIEAAIYDRSGRRRRTLCTPEEPVGYEIPWDGKDDDGWTLPAGIYIVFAVDSEGNSAKAAVAVKGGRR